MTTTVDIPWSDRLEFARRILAGSPPHLPGHIGDQVRAAATDAAAGIDYLSAVLPVLEPSAAWATHQAIVADDQVAYLIAGLIGCNPCGHVRRLGPQPVVAGLPLRRLDCRRCLSTVRKPPPAEADRCDLCGRRGVEMFAPMVIGYGPVTLVGDVCDDCAAVLRTEHADPRSKP